MAIREKQKVPLVVMHHEKDEPYVQMIASPKSNPTDKSGADLEQWLVDVPSAEYGCWTNGIETIYFQKKSKFETDVFQLTTFLDMVKMLVYLYNRPQKIKGCNRKQLALCLQTLPRLHSRQPRR